MVSSAAAMSGTEKPSTSLSSSAARCFGGKALDGDNERSGDVFASFVDVGGVVWVGLHPHRFEADLLAFPRHRDLLAGLAAERVDAAVGCYAVEPGSKRGSAGVGPEASPRPEQGLLENVVGVVDRAGHSVAVPVEFVAVRRDSTVECSVVTGLRAAEVVVFARGFPLCSFTASPASCSCRSGGRVFDRSRRLNSSVRKKCWCTR